MITPRAEDCFGRDALIEEMILAANEHRSVLLFGGRQSGKTSILVRTRFLLGKKIQDEKAHLRTSVTVPVYLDLMKLPYDAGPADLFFQMFDAANSACSQLLGSRYLWRIPWPTFCKTMSFEQLVARIDGLLRKRKGLDIRLIFLFDEAKRVLGDRFPRGFQDNLFAFLYSPEIPICNNVAIVFAGAQELASFAEDDTSPIASRAARCLVPNLDRLTVKQIIGQVIGAPLSNHEDIIADRVYGAAGGHAGLSRSMISQLSKLRNEGDRADVEERVRQTKADALQRHEPLFRIWDDAFSTEARAIKNELGSKRALALKDLPALLVAHGLNNFQASRSVDELIYTSVALRHEGIISNNNELYWLHEQAHRKGFEWTDKATAVWTKIEETEKSLRDLIYRRYQREWAERTSVMIREVVGEDGWDKIQKNYEASIKKYPLSATPAESRIVDLMYIGQLLALIIFRKAWHLFNDVFKDKKSLTAMFGAIVPVRNDQAHFNSVPEKELMRCYVACDDLLVLIGRAEDIGRR